MTKLLFYRFYILVILFLMPLVFVSNINASPSILLSLDDCLKIVLTHSDELAYARADIDKESEKYKSAKKDLYPSLSSSYAYIKKKPKLTSIENNYTYNISIEQPVYRGGALETAIEISALNIEGAKASLAESKNNLLLSVHRAYYSLLKAQKIEEQANLSVKRLQSHLKDAKAFYDAGLIPKNDLLISEVELAQAIQDQLAAQNATSLAKSQLNIMMKQKVDAELLIVDILDSNKRNIDWDNEIEKALKSRPELAKLKINTEFAEKNIKISTANYLPSVSLSATYQKIGDDPLANYYPLGPSEGQSAQIAASWNFWSWGQKDNEIAAAKMDYVKAKKSYNQISDAVILQTREAYLYIVHAEKNISVALKALLQAEENFRINQARYKAQLSTSTDVLDAQSLLSRANTNYFNTLYEYKIALASLDWATGSLANDSPSLPVSE